MIVSGAPSWSKPAPSTCSWSGTQRWLAHHRFGQRATHSTVREITLRWLNRPPELESLRINAVAAMVLMPRWQAWAYVLGLNVVGPYFVGALALLALLGLGRLLAPDGDLETRMVLGLLGATALRG